jgi:hypothetical protein
MRGEPYQLVRRSHGEGGFFLNTPWGGQAFKKSLLDFFSAGASLPRGQWEPLLSGKIYDPKISVRLFSIY